MYPCAAAVVLWVALGGDHWSVRLAVVPMVAAATIYLYTAVIAWADPGPEPDE